MYILIIVLWHFICYVNWKENKNSTMSHLFSLRRGKNRLITLLIFSFQFNTKINFTIKLSFQLKFEEIKNIGWKSSKSFKIENSIFRRFSSYYVNKYSASFASSFVNKKCTIYCRFNLLPFLIPTKNVNIFDLYNNKK